MKDKPHISLKAESLIEVFGFNITNSYLTSLIVILFFFLIAFHYYQQSKLPAKQRSTIFYLFNFTDMCLFYFFYFSVHYV